MEPQGAQTMPPAERPQASVLTLLQGSCHIRDGNAHTYHLMLGRVPILYHTKHIHIEHGEVHLQVFVNLALCHL